MTVETASNDLIGDVVTIDLETQQATVNSEQ